MVQEPIKCLECDIRQRTEYGELFQNEPKTMFFYACKKHRKYLNGSYVVGKEQEFKSFIKKELHG